MSHFTASGGGKQRLLTRFLLLLALLAPAPTVFAEGNTVLHRMLKDGANFRVRVRAAMALGRAAEGADAAALERALWDRHPAVRAAAAQALARVGAQRSLPALRIASRDGERSVAKQAQAAIAAIERRRPNAHRAGTRVAASTPSTPATADAARARFGVVVGDVHNRSGFQGRDLADQLRRALADGLRGRADVAVIDQASGGTGLSTLRRRGVPVFRLDANLVSVKRGASGGDVSVRCEVSLLLLDEGERTIRSMLKGAATHVASARGPRASQERLMARKALGSAVQSALSNAWRALDTAAAAAPAAKPQVRRRGTYASR